MKQRMKVGLRTVAVVLTCAAAACAQKPMTSSFVATIGANDTVAVESWTRWPDSLTGSSVTAYPRATVRSYKVTFDPQGEVTGIHMTAGAPGATSMTTSDFSYSGDSVTVQMQRDTVTRRAAVATDGERPLPFYEDLFAFWNLGLKQSMPPGTTTPDSMTMGSLAGSRVLPITLRRAGASAVDFGFPQWGTGEASFGEDGSLDHIDLTKTTSKYTVVRVPSVDVQARATAWGARPQPGILSPRDTASATVGRAHVVVDYGRPSVRGRTVYGGELIPFGKVWRTGANAATQLIIDRPLVMDGTTIPAGTYSVWSEATDATTWSLIINKQHGQWGTQYDASQDLAHIPITKSSLTEPVEKFTITVASTGRNAGTLTLAWGNVQGVVAFTVK